MTGDDRARPRLDLQTLERGRADVALPAYDPADVEVGIVHLGIGAFHRAHQAVYTDDVLGAAADGWGICGVAQTRPDVVEQLRPQNGLFTVSSKGRDGTELRVVGAVREVLQAQTDAPLVRTRLADERVRVVTSTVTEGGYRGDLARGRIDRTDPMVQADLRGAEPFRTVVGQLAGGFAKRRRDDAGPVTVLSCDNLTGNSRLLAALLDDFCSQASFSEAAAVRAWIQENVAFADTVVDRVVPATRPEDLADVERRLGLLDAGCVVAEPARRWVIEDTFAAARPEWERAGAVLTPDVTPYAQAKLRLLNGGHSLLAYLAAPERGGTVSDAVADTGVAAVLRHYLAEAATTLGTASVRGYDADEIVGRFANPAIRHHLEQIAADGSKKVPQRLVPVAATCVATGRDPTWSALGVAAWIRYVRSAAEQGRTIIDPLGDSLVRIAARGAWSEMAPRLLATVGVDPDLTATPAFRSAVLGWLVELERHGLRAAVAVAEEQT